MKVFRRLFAGTAFAIYVAASSGSPDLTSEVIETGSLTVTKTVFSSKMRFFFPVGLEGTGHHYVKAVEGHLFKNNKDLGRIKGHGAVKPDVFEINKSMGNDVQHYVISLNTARGILRSLAQGAEELEFPGTVVSVPGRHSYPNGFGPNKALKYIDLRMMAETAEEEGVDFRVLYMRRPVTDIIIANTIHRDFQTSLHNSGRASPQVLFMQYMQILITDIAVLHSFLSELGPGFVVCHDFDRIGDMDQSAFVSDFLAPNRDVAAMLNESFITVAEGYLASNDTLQYEGADVIASRLQRKFDVFEAEICSGTMKD